MRLVPDTGVRVLQGHEQLKLCGFDGTVLVSDVVTLKSSDPVTPPPGGGPDFTGGFAGLAFDRHCRLFRARPEDAAVEFVLWGRTDSIGVHEAEPQPFEFTGSEQVEGSALPKRPLALACDNA